MHVEKTSGRSRRCTGHGTPFFREGWFIGAAPAQRPSNCRIVGHAGEGRKADARAAPAARFGSDADGVAVRFDPCPLPRRHRSGAVAWLSRASGGVPLCGGVRGDAGRHPSRPARHALPHRSWASARGRDAVRPLVRRRRLGVRPRLPRRRRAAQVQGEVCGDAPAQGTGGLARRGYGGARRVDAGAHLAAQRFGRAAMKASTNTPISRRHSVSLEMP